MTTTDKKIDAYIMKSADFAKPILIHIREQVHKACPDVEEGMKWSFPHFMYKDSILCSMASFKHHCAFGFWLGAVMEDPNKILRSGENKTAMGHLGQLTSLKDLPSDKVLKAYIKEAMSLIDKGVKLEKKPSAETKKELKVPTYFMNALKKNKKALNTFEKFSNTNKKEYVEWIDGAKTEETRESRLETALEWMSEGKIRHWKYAKK
jgi:uncharacterized protein YdeI (YjbR/CyaY-like superfamily)